MPGGQCIAVKYIKKNIYLSTYVHCCISICFNISHILSIFIDVFKNVTVYVNSSLLRKNTFFKTKNACEPCLMRRGLLRLQTALYYMPTCMGLHLLPIAYGFEPISSQKKGGAEAYWGVYQGTMGSYAGNKYSQPQSSYGFVNLHYFQNGESKFIK